MNDFTKMLHLVTCWKRAAMQQQVGFAFFHRICQSTYEEDTINKTLVNNAYYFKIFIILLQNHSYYFKRSRSFFIKHIIFSSLLIKRWNKIVRCEYSTDDNHICSSLNDFIHSSFTIRESILNGLLLGTIVILDLSMLSTGQ